MSVSENRQAVATAVQKGQKKSQRDQFIAEAKQIKAASLGLLGSAANINEMIKAAQAAGIEMDMDTLQTAAGTLAKDLMAFRGELEQLDVKTMERLGKLTPKTDELEVMLVTSDIATNYQNWQERFAQITEPNLLLITNICTGEHKPEEVQAQQGEE